MAATNVGRAALDGAARVAGLDVVVTAPTADATSKTNKRRTGFNEGAGDSSEKSTADCSRALTRRSLVLHCVTKVWSDVIRTAPQAGPCNYDRDLIASLARSITVAAEHPSTSEHAPQRGRGR